MKTTTEINQGSRYRRLFKIVVFALMILVPLAGTCQGITSLAVSNIDTRRIGFTPEDLGNLIRIELEKKGLFNIVDKYDMSDQLTKKGIDITECYGKTCVVNMGKALEVDKVLTGSIESFGEKIIISLRLIDVASAFVEKTDVSEYQDIIDELPIMIEISVNNILGIENDPNLVELLVNFEEPISSKHISVRMNGPRMGIAYVTGDLANSIMAPKNEGGYDGYPFLSQFGYQYEIQYLSAGNFNALIEFLGMVSGLEQQLFIPSIIFMNGFRFGKGNWEFAFGPAVSLRKEAVGFYDKDLYLGEEGGWHLEHEWSNDYPEIPNPYLLVQRMDSRGEVGVKSRWIWAVGKTFRSGYLNIPFNLYWSPQKSGSYYGCSIGFNINRAYKRKNK